MYFVQLRIAPQNPKTPISCEVNLVILADLNFKHLTLTCHFFIYI